MKIILIFSVLILSHLVHARDYSPTFGSSTSEDKLNAYIDQCVSLPPSEVLEKEFQNEIKIEKRKIARYGTVFFKSKYPRYSRLMETLRHNYITHIDIDGFLMEKILPNELEILLELTSHRDFHSTLFDEYYTMTVEVKNRVLFIKRKCVSKTCISNLNRKLSFVFNLESVKNTEPFCKGVLCASKRIFGDPKGIYLVYAMDKYGISLSRYSTVSADPEGLKLEDLKSVLMGLDATPKHLYTRALEGQTFYRFLKGFVKRGHPHTASASVEGSLYDEFVRSKRPWQMRTVVHEIGHRADKKNFKNMSESDKWLAISGFRVVHNGYNLLKNYERQILKKSVSPYGDTNPKEDWAESYTKYRLNPKDLKSKFPKRYNFMRDFVFDGIEYTENLCEGIRKN